jgi:hypothetical protein
VVMSSSDDANVSIMLIERTKTTSFDTKNGGFAEKNGASIQFPADGFVQKNGSPYHGNVNVDVTYLNPNDPQLSKFMPGDLSGVNKSGEIKSLISFGMVGVELYDDNGNALQLGNQKEAQITVPALSTELNGVKLNSIPAWHFDENIGTWEEEGKFNLTGSVYVANVKHFSYWNVDYPSAPSVYLSGRILDRKGVPANNALIKVYFQNNGKNYSAQGWTGADGTFKGIIPKGLELIMMIIYKNDGVPQFDSKIGPFDQDEDMGDIYLKK